MSKLEIEQVRFRERNITWLRAELHLAIAHITGWQYAQEWGDRFARKFSAGW